MMFYPGQAGAPPKSAGATQLPLFVKGPRPVRLGPAHPTAHLPDRARMAFSGSALDSGGAPRDDHGGAGGVRGFLAYDPASCARRDDAGSRAAQAAATRTLVSPYGVLAPRQPPPPRSAGKPPSSSGSAAPQRKGSGGRARHTAPRTRFPRNFPQPALLPPSTAPLRPHERSASACVPGTSHAVAPIAGLHGTYTSAPRVTPQGAEMLSFEDSPEHALQNAMQELDELRGLALTDERDSWRLAEAQRRPKTAPLHRPSTACAALATSTADEGSEGGVRVETEAELRARLGAAENVMRKLYRKNTQLEEMLATRPKTAAPSPTVESAPANEDGPGASEAQALFLLQQKETDLQKMRDYTSQLAARLETLSQDQLAMKNDGEQAATAARNAEYRERYLRMRTEYRQLLRSRTDSIKKSGKVSQEQERNVLLEQLDVALRDEAELHRRESQRLNEELYLQEKKNCDSYVEKRLLQDRLAALEREMAARDELEGEIDGKMVALFNRLKQLEDANLNLEQEKEQLKGKLGAHPAELSPAAA
ncbi:hypothetical protein AB1Y20_018547 [Prymnesium parvum]|uniref:Centrosomal protein of 162 kDa n=1 Tax=Prymnesium parvum TaxID=97485 RepID=A0AB34JP21_PRYPA